MQDPDESKDEKICLRVQELINHPERATIQSSSSRQSRGRQHGTRRPDTAASGMTNVQEALAQSLSAEERQQLASIFGVPQEQFQYTCFLYIFAYFVGTFKTLFQTK